MTALENIMEIVLCILQNRCFYLRWRLCGHSSDSGCCAEEVLDYYAVAQCTPGVIAVNTATFVGYKQMGVLGAIAATFGVMLPSFLIITVIASVLQNFMQYKIVGHVFGGIRIAVAVLIVNAVITMGKKAIKDILCVFLGLGAFAVSMIFPNLSPVFVVLAAALLGFFTMKREGADK